MQYLSSYGALRLGRSVLDGGNRVTLIWGHLCSRSDSSWIRRGGPGGSRPSNITADRFAGFQASRVCVPRRKHFGRRSWPAARPTFPNPGSYGLLVYIRPGHNLPPCALRGAAQSMCAPPPQSLQPLVTHCHCHGQSRMVPTSDRRPGVHDASPGLLACTQSNGCLQVATSAIQIQVGKRTAVPVTVGDHGVIARRRKSLP